MTARSASVGMLAGYLRGIAFPATRAEIVDYARRQGAKEESLQVLDELPDDHYGSMAEIFAGVREEAYRHAAGEHPQPMPPPRPAPAPPKKR